MKTVFLSHSAAPSGAELSLLRSLRHWPLGHEVVVIFGEHGPMVEACRRAGVAVEVFVSSRTVTRRGTRITGKARGLIELGLSSQRLRRRLRQLDPDVVVGRSLRAVLYGRLASLGLRCKFVWSVHDRLTVQYLGKSAILFSRVMPWFTDGLIVNSESTLQTLTQKSRPVLVLPPGLDASSAVAHEVRPTVTRVVSVGRLAPWKGQDLLIRAFAEAFTEVDARLVVVGDALFGETDYVQQLRILASDLRIQHRVEFTGHLNDPFAQLRQADVMVHSSRMPEPFGAVVVEGMHAGCIVIATKPGGPAETIEPGVTGILVNGGDEAEMVMALLQVKQMSTEARSVMARKAQEASLLYASDRLARVLADWLATLGQGHPQAALVQAVVKNV